METLGKSRVGHFIRYGLIVAFALAMIGAAPSAAAQVDDLDQAFQRKDWAKVQEVALLWAASLSPGRAEVAALAAAGMRNQAISVAQGTFPISRPTLLLQVLTASKDLQPAQKLELLTLAFDASSAISDPESAAESLAEVAIAYASLGLRGQGAQHTCLCLGTGRDERIGRCIQEVGRNACAFLGTWHQPGVDAGRGRGQCCSQPSEPRHGPDAAGPGRGVGQWSSHPGEPKQGPDALRPGERLFSLGPERAGQRES